MSVIIDTRDHEAAASAFPDSRRYSGDWDGLIYKITSFIGMAVTFMLGLVAVFLTFDNQGRIKILSEGLKPNLDIAARLDTVEKQTQEIQVGQRDAQIAQDRLVAKVADTERDLSLLARNTERLADETEARFAASDVHLGNLDQQFSKMDLRMGRFEETQQGAQNIAKESGGETVATRSSSLGPAAEKAPVRLSRFSVIRLDGRAAWIAAPEGWLHVAVGEKLPGGATVLDVNTQRNKVAVVTDQGIITRGK